MPIFIHFPKVAHWYEWSITFLDISETTALFVIASIGMLSTFVILESILITYRKIRTKLGYKNARTLAETPFFSALVKSSQFQRIRAWTLRFFR